MDRPLLPSSSIGAHDLNAALVGVLADLVGLIERGVLLVFGGHAHVLRGAEEFGFSFKVALISRSSFVLDMFASKAKPYQGHVARIVDIK